MLDIQSEPQKYVTGKSKIKRDPWKSLIPYFSDSNIVPPLESVCRANRSYAAEDMKRATQESSESSERIIASQAGKKWWSWYRYNIKYILCAWTIHLPNIPVKK